MATGAKTTLAWAALLWLGACANSPIGVPSDAASGADAGSLPGPADAPPGCEWSLLEHGFQDAVAGMFWDGPNQRLILIERGGDSELRLLPAPTRAALSTKGTRPTSLFEHNAAMVNDPARRRILVANVDDQNTASHLFALSLDDSPTWSEVALTAPAPPRQSGVMVVTSKVDVLAQCSGWNGQQYLHDSAVLALGGPAQWVPFGGGLPFEAGDQPKGAAWDPARARVLVRLGRSGRIWALGIASGSLWTELPVSPALPPLFLQPGPRSDVYDPIGDALLVVGGIMDGDSRLALFRLPLGGQTDSGFTRVETRNAPERSSLDVDYPMAYDELGDRLFVQIDWSFGGRPNEIWSLPLARCR